MKSEEEWRKEDDACTLARAKEIEADPTRLAGAQQAARKMLTEEKSRLNGLAKVAGKKAPGSSEPKTNASPGTPAQGGVIDLTKML